MNAHKLALVAVLTASLSYAGTAVFASERWQEGAFPPPNGGHLVFAVTADGNPACASYDAASCLWGSKLADIDFSKVKPLVCGAAHRRLYGVTGFEDPRHWCSLARGDRTAQKAPAVQPAPPPAPAGVYRLTEWSPWSRAAGVEYRYRVGRDPASAGPGKTVDAVYEIRNRGGQRWSGVARSLSCEQGTLWGSTDVSLAPGQTREVRVRAPNCGSAGNPDIRPNLVRSGRFD